MALQPASSGSARAGANDLRVHNLSLLLRVVMEEGPRSRASLSSRTGLTRSAVSSLVAELIARGLLEEQRSTQGQMGRPATPLGISGRTVAAVSIEVTTDLVRAIGTDLSGARFVEIARDLAHLEGGARSLESELSAVVRLAIQAIPETCRYLAGVAVAVPGVIDSASGRLRFAPNLAIVDLPIRSIVEEVVGVGCHIEVMNEADLAAGAAALSRSGSTLFLIFGSVGIGGGWVVDGTVHTGFGNAAGEVGHMVVDPDGARCRCGAVGCWETRIGLRAIARACGLEDAESDEVDASSLLDQICARATVGDAAVLAGLEASGRWLGRGIASIVVVVSPDEIAIAGTLGSLAEWVLPAATAEIELRVQAITDLCPMYPILPTADLVIAGAHAQAMQPVVDNPTLVPMTMEADSGDREWQAAGGHF